MDTEKSIYEEVMTIIQGLSPRRRSQEAYPLADYCKGSYEGYKRQIEVIVNCAANYESIEMVDFPINAVDSEDKPLSIYAVKRQYGQPTHVVIRFSGSHGIEGFIGAAGQLHEIESTFHIPQNTLFIEVFAYNVWGFCNLRRSSSKNYDYNFTHFSKSTSDMNDLYEEATKVKPRKRSISLPLLKRKKSKSKVEKHDVMELFRKGQNKSENGLFYNGGEHLDEGTEALFAWLENEVKEAKRIVCIDIHSEPGEWCHQSLQVFDYNNEWSSEKMKCSFGNTIEYISGSSAKKGDVCSKVHEVVRRVNEEAEVVGIRQTIGTYPVYEVMPILFDENIAYMELSKYGKKLPHDHQYKQKLLEAFYPSNRQWRHMAVAMMQQLFEESTSFVHYPNKSLSSPSSHRNTRARRFSRC